MGTRELPGLRQRVLLTGCADFANEIEFVGVVDEHDVLRRVGNIKEAILVIDDHSAGIEYAIADRAFDLMVLIEYEDAVQLGIGNKEAVGVVDSQADDVAKARLHSVLDHLHLFGFGVEDEDCAHFSVGDVKIAL